MELQTKLARHDGVVRAVTAYTAVRVADAIHPTKYHWHIHEQDEPKAFLGILSQAYNDDLFQAGWGMWKRGPKYLSRGWWYDVSTAALADDDPRVPYLPEPWCSSRLWLYPMIAGLFLAHNPHKK
jgi:hypothetical protein